MLTDPLLSVKEDQDDLILEKHLSKANELWKVALPHNKAMVLFQGYHTYIHPGWYPTMEGFLKMHQHHAEENRVGVIEGLSNAKVPHACAVAQIMQKLEPCKK